MTTQLKSFRIAQTDKRPRAGKRTALPCRAGTRRSDRFVSVSSPRPHRLFAPAITALMLLTMIGSTTAAQLTPEMPVELKGLALRGGLCIQLGSDRLTLATQLAHSGHFLVQVLDSSPQRVDALRQQLARSKDYGLLSIEPFAPGGKLPYTENLVNLAIVDQSISADQLRELERVLCPNGTVLIRRHAANLNDWQRAGFALSDNATASGTIQVVHKPWPEVMDEWTHARHSATGNAVSQDTMVGPPRRVRWLAGPWQEVGNMVTGGGCNFYGGILARDGFNGLRLWEATLNPSPARGGFSYRPRPGTATPIVGGQFVFTASGGEIEARHVRTGAVAQTLSVSSTPHHLLYDSGTLLSIAANQIVAFTVADGHQRWTHSGTAIRHAVAGDGIVTFLEGDLKRGQPLNVVTLDRDTGKPRWQRADYKWAARVSRIVYHQGLLAFEISTLNNDGPGSAIKLVSAKDGQPVYERDFLPGMNHMRQARAMFIGDRMWLLEGGLGEDKKREPTRATAVYIPTGEVQANYPAGLAHCFPPVATVRYLFSGEMNLTDLQSGTVDANHITKAACGRDAGWIPAHGLVNVTPKHCVCWPMLRGYVAMAPARSGGNPAAADLRELDFPVDKGVAPPVDGKHDAPGDWPMYRHDAWRSASTPTVGPRSFDALWSVAIGAPPDHAGPIRKDWLEDPFIKGPLTPPVIAGDTAVVACPHAHQVIAVDARTGQQRWRFVASGRVDTPPTLYAGLCLFGSKNGWVYCLRLADGKLVWRLRVAPLAERIVAYGQLESPWPVPGSVLVFDDVAYFAAGRQSFADGGILVFAVDARTGVTRWVQRLDTIPQKGYYTSSALEFDNFDILFRQGDDVAMSRWVFEGATGKMSVDLWKAFARVDTGGGAVMMPPGCWSYAPRNESRTKTFSPRRPLVAFRDHILVGCREDKRAVYRRDFNLENGETFDSKWITGWAGSDGSRNGGLAWRSQRLAEKAKWMTDLDSDAKSKPTVVALALTADRALAVASDGQLHVVDLKSGRQRTQPTIGVPVWDGIAVAQNRLYVALQNGRLVCLGEKTR